MSDGIKTIFLFLYLNTREASDKHLINRFLIKINVEHLFLKYFSIHFLLSILGDNIAEKYLVFFCPR